MASASGPTEVDQVHVHGQREPLDSSSTDASIPAPPEAAAAADVSPPPSSSSVERRTKQPGVGGRGADGSRSAAAAVEQKGKKKISVPESDDHDREQAEGEEEERKFDSASASASGPAEADQLHGQHELQDSSSSATQQPGDGGRGTDGSSSAAAAVERKQAERKSDSQQDKLLGSSIRAASESQDKEHGGRGRDTDRSSCAAAVVAAFHHQEQVRRKEGKIDSPKKLLRGSIIPFRCLSGRKVPVQSKERFNFSFLQHEGPNNKSAGVITLSTQSCNQSSKSRNADREKLPRTSTVTLHFEENLMDLHDLFDCLADRSPKCTLREYLDQLDTLIISEATPGGFEHISRTTAPEVKRLIRETYLLLVALHQKGFCLRGGFGVDNFIVLQTRQRITVKFANVANETLENIEPNGKKLDLESFTRIIRRSVFEKQLPPHDIVLWLSLIGNEEIEGLMPDHALLMDTETCGGSFMAWYDDFVDLKEKRSKKFEDICSNLESYNGWRKRFDHEEGNCLLSETLNIGSYGDTVDELLRLLRNSRQHSSRYRHALFALIVGQDFPNLIADFQKEMYKAGCLGPSPRF